MRAMSDPAREILQGLFACVLEDILKYGILCVDNRFFVSYTYFTLTSSSKKEAKKSAAFDMLLYVLGYEKED